VQLIISYGAGSTGDVSMRILTEQLTTKLGQPFLVINKPGAGGIAAAQAAAATAPDGYTLLLTGNSSTISVALFKSLPYNILTDFSPVSMVANFDMVVLVKAGSPLKSMQDIVAYAKANPGKLNMGTLAPMSPRCRSAPRRT
jgi:tripartite-type tricarboxylate transporter receptor subunit TctC